MERGEVWWVELPSPTGSGPGFKRPVVIVQADAFNQSRIKTIVAAIITSNLRLAEAPGNVLVPAAEAGLPKDSVVNVSQIATMDRELLENKCGRLPASVMRSVDEGLRLVLSL